MTPIKSIVLAGFSLCIVLGAQAQDAVPNTDRGVRLIVVHEPESDSYFELRRVIGSTVLGSTERGMQIWQAEVFATSFEYEGRRGRLAVIDTPAKHALITAEVIPVLVGDSENEGVWNTNAWIGLRYWCKYRRLMWVTGETIDGGVFAPWDQPYFAFTNSCETNAPYMGVFYNSNGLWQAVGFGKEWKHLLIEYPRLPGDQAAR